MANNRRIEGQATKWMRWIAHGIGSFASAFWLLVGVGEAISEPTPWSLEGAMLAVLLTTTVLGVLIAWWWEEIGGTIVMIDALALCTFAYVTVGRNKTFAMLLSGGPFLVASILFLASWRRTRSYKIPQSSE